jgi:hypothetical protein
MTTVNDLINALGNNKTGTANTAFADLMTSKINAALDTKRISMANAVYNGAIDKQEHEEDADLQTIEDEAE